jgi:DNA helicase-2/ATP-dependent DNA helicase PcrA
MPYLRNISGQNVQVVDSLTYAQYMLSKIQHEEKYKTLDYVTRNNFETGGQFFDRINHTQALHIRDDGALCIGKLKRPLAGVGKASAEQYKELLAELLKDEGIIRYQDAYAYANAAITELPTEYTDLFSSRFQYVFIDEYQDCNNLQRQAIDAIFDPQKCAVFKIGDSDQAIYNSAVDTTPDWIPQPDFLPIMTSCRFNQEIANVLCKLKKGEKNIVTLAGETGVKPVLLVFSLEKIDRVIGGFISALERYELYDNNGIYKAIGAIKKEDSAGLKIGSYWAEFDASVKKKSEYSYWTLVDEIVQYLFEGKLYKVEQIVRRLLCRVFHYIPIKHPVSGKDYTPATMKTALDEKYRVQYHKWIYEMPRMQTIDRHSVDQVIRLNINDLLRVNNPSCPDIFTVLPEFFLEETTGVNLAEISEKNVLIDPIRGRRIVFDTIHGVKGETHDATLYLETDRQGASDLNRILPYFGVGRCGSSNLYDSSRKLAYVGMSRPKKLLCVAMQAKTYEKSKGVFDTDWEVIDLRG